MMFQLVCTILILTVLASSETDEIKTKYAIFREDCFNKVIGEADFSDKSYLTECFSFTVVRTVGYGTMIMGAVLKFPQIIKIVRSGRVDGIAIVSYYLEMIGYSTSAARGLVLGIPFSVWAEPLVPFTFNIIIIFLMWTLDRKNYSMVEIVCVTAFIIGWCVF
jgi:uncharacterized protein with PQ loop repeat